MLALVLGSAIGVVSQALVTFQAPQGHRASFYLELFLALVAAAALIGLLATRAAAGLAVLLAALAFLPSRSGMQFQVASFVIVSAMELVLVLGILVLFVHRRIVQRARLRPTGIGRPLRVWLLFLPLGAAIGALRGVPALNILTEVMDFYLPILAAVLCVNVIRTIGALRLVAAIAVLSALPDLVFQYHDFATGSAPVGTTIGNGVSVVRSAGGAGGVNQFAFYIMALLFVALGLGMAARGRFARLLFYGSAVALFAGVILTFTRGAWIATAVGLLVLGIAGGRRVLAGLLIAGVVAYALIPPVVWTRLNFTDNSTAERIGYLQVAVPALLSYPLTGGGWGSSFYVVGSTVVPTFDPGNMPFWHDDYLIVGTQVGFPGLAAFVWLLGSVGWMLWSAYRRAPPGELRIYLLVLLAALAAMCTQAFTEMFFWIPQIAPFIWLLIGLACSAVQIIDAGEARHGDLDERHDARPAAAGNRDLSFDVTPWPY